MDCKKKKRNSIQLFEGKINKKFIKIINKIICQNKIPNKYSSLNPPLKKIQQLTKKHKNKKYNSLKEVNKHMKKKKRS